MSTRYSGRITGDNWIYIGAAVILASFGIVCVCQYFHQKTYRELVTQFREVDALVVSQRVLLSSPQIDKNEIDQVTAAISSRRDRIKELKRQLPDGEIIGARLNATIGSFAQSL